MTFFKAFCLIYVIKLCSAEFFSSVYHMESLVHTEKYLIDMLEDYIAEEEKLLQDMKTRVGNLKKQHESASIYPIEYLSNPINEYLLIKRLYMEWKDIEHDIALGPEKVLREGYQYLMENKLFPTLYDLAGAAEGIFRLQRTYAINATTFASGKFSKIIGDTEMSARDCFDIGLQAHHGKNYNRSTEWLLESYRRSVEEENPGVNWIRLLDILANSLFRMGDAQQALFFVNQLLTIAPNSEKAKDDKHKYESILQRRKDISNESDENGNDLLKDPYYFDIHEYMRYIRVCRGEQHLSPTQQAKLTCYYNQKIHPVLKIAPVKVEEVHLHPYVVVFHDVLYDNEIKEIMKVSKPELQRSQTLGGTFGHGRVEEYRISQSTRIRSEKYSFLKKIDNRIEIMTGLSMGTAEGHQIANYGIGGHYEPHLDFSSKYDPTPLPYINELGNRIASLVFYLTDVPEGGSTAFPYLNIKVNPIKGSALFWHNLFKDGEGNYLTRHAACPVLVGNKWSDNVWLRERDQEFKRSCDLLPDHEPDEVWTSLFEKQNSRSLKNDDVVY